MHCDNYSESYRTILCKVYFVIVSNIICKRYSLEFLGSGNSWGQVSSQTSTNFIFSDVSILSPLLGLSKDNIIEMARSIDTYDLSICDVTEDCC